MKCRKATLSHVGAAIQRRPFVRQTNRHKFSTPFTIKHGGYIMEPRKLSPLAFEQVAKTTTLDIACPRLAILKIRQKCTCGNPPLKSIFIRAIRNAHRRHPSSNTLMTLMCQSTPTESPGLTGQGSSFGRMKHPTQLSIQLHREQAYPLLSTSRSLPTNRCLLHPRPRPRDQTSASVPGMVRGHSVVGCKNTNLRQYFPANR